MQVEQLHAELRDCCDLMGIGLSSQSRDTIVEADTAAGTATASGAKDLGDVRCSRSCIVSRDISCACRTFSVDDGIGCQCQRDSVTPCPDCWLIVTFHRINITLRLDSSNEVSEFPHLQALPE